MDLVKIYGDPVSFGRPEPEDPEGANGLVAGAGSRASARGTATETASRIRRGVRLDPRPAQALLGTEASAKYTCPFWQVAMCCTELHLANARHHGPGVRLARPCSRRRRR